MGPGGGAAPGRSATQLLLTVLGDYWYATRDHIPSAALVAVLGGLGVSEDAVRAALSRLCQQGWLERSRDGRSTSYRLADGARERAAERGRALLRYGAEPVAWDGMWTCVAFSVPEAARPRRGALRKRLRSLGMGPLYDGLWASPHPIVDGLSEALEELGVTDATVLRATEVPRAAGMPVLAAWDLAAVRDRIDDLLGALDDVGGRVEDGVMGPAEALHARTDLMGAWRVLAATDPRLPDDLLPPDWPLRRAHDRFVAVYDALGPLSELRVRQLVGAEPGAPGGPRHHRLADLA